MSLPLSIVIDELKTTPTSIVPILTALHSAKAQFASISKVDLKHLTGRTLNLCRSNDTYAVWCGINIIHVLAESSEIVGADGQAFFAQILKNLSSGHAQNGNVLECGIECLMKLCDYTRGKPTLTREILTPNLNGIFSMLLEKLSLRPVLVLGCLRKLIQEHPTTSRPFANKVKTYILNLVSKDDFQNYPQQLRDEACATLACLPVIEKEKPEQHWSRDVNAIISEIVTTLDIYTNFLNVKDDQEATSLLKSLSGSSDDDGIFPSLSIDINHPSTIFTISQRTSMLLELLQGYVLGATSFAVMVPIGKVLSLIDLICALSTRFIAFKREIRDVEVRSAVELSLTRCHCAALKLLRQLPAKYSGSVIPHLSAIFATFESMVFLQNKRLDHARILANELVVREVINCTTAYLNLVTYFTDHSSLSRIIEAALFLVQPRAGNATSVSEADKIKLSSQSKSARKKAKRNAAVPLSDLLSHEHLFEGSAPTSTRKAVSSFFERLIRKVPISSTHYNKILKFVMVEAVKHADSTRQHCVSEDIKNLLIAASLHPGPESASILPIATTLLPSSNVLGVLNFPRFPPLPVIVKGSVGGEEDEEDDDEDEELGKEPAREVSPPKRFKAGPKDDISFGDARKSSSAQTSASVSSADIFTSKPFKPLDQNNEDVDDIKPEGQIERIETVINEAASQVSEVVEEEMDSDGGSEIEIPDLDLEDSDDEN